MNDFPQPGSLHRNGRYAEEITKKVVLIYIFNSMHYALPLLCVLNIDVLLTSTV